MSFVKRVQRRKISRPNQHSFTPEQWNKAIDPSVADEQDKSLHQAGLWFYRAFGELRKQLSFAADPQVPKKNKLLAFITHANLNAMMYEHAAKEIGENTAGLDPADITRQQLVPKFSDNQGTEHSIDEVAQADIDGLHMPLQMVLAEKSDAWEPDIATTPVDLKRVQRDYPLGAFYGVLEQHWEDCLWNDYRFEQDAHITLTPGNRHFAAWKVISQFRRNILVHSNTTARIMHFSQHYGQNSHTELGIPRPVRAISALDGVTRYHLADDNDVQRSALATYLIIHEALEPYYTGYAAFSAPTLEGATINDVVRCWAVLCSLTRCLLEAPEVPPQTQRVDSVLVHVAAPMVDKAALRTAVSESLGVGPARSQALIDFLTFDPADKSDTGKNELWTQPLIPYSDEKLLILFTPLLWGTTQRNVNIWLRQMGADLAVRGTSFETHVRQVLERYADRSRLKKHLRIMKHALKFNLPKGGTPPYEDIDLLMLIGNTLVIGEVKCFLQPADTLSTFQHRDKVIDACAQLARKIERIQRHEKSFRKQCLKANFSLPDTFSIQPVVVLNGPAHCGIPYNGTPIVDTYILSTFLTGIIRQNIMESASEGVVAEEQILLYTDLSEAEANLADYLSAPPQLDYIKAGLSMQESLRKQIAEPIEDIRYRYFEVVL
ncbi:hypothetical protein PFWH6_2286 [Pseudomonas fluorescens WH6]|nr:hypothetical protein PFWH6_2286 [Pseudomonas fluorescens WH6]